MRLLKRTGRLAVLCCALPLAAADRDGGADAAGGAPKRPIAEITVETDYSGKAATDFPGHRTDVTAWAHSVQAVSYPEIRSNLHGRFGAGWNRLTLDADQPEVLPSKLQSAYAVLGGDWRFSRRWDLRFETRPGLYGDLSDVHSQTVNSPVVVGFSYFASPKWLVLGGFLANPNGDMPFFPFAGFRYQASKALAVEFLAPRPRVVYDLTDRLSIYGGFEFRGGSYRMARDYGTRVGDPRLNNELLSFREYRAAAGAEYDLTRILALDLSAGYVLERRLHYRDANVNQYAHRAPFVQANLKLRLF